MIDFNKKTSVQFSYEKKEILMRADNVSVKLGGNEIIRDINFEIHNIVRPNLNQGQIISIVGRSGIGKSTLFRTLSGFMKPTTGNVFINEDQHIVTEGEIGMIPQNYLLFDHLTVKGNLNLALSNNPVLRLKKDIINFYADSFDLLQHLDKKPNQLSGGQRQRTSIIQQILAGNNFILMDEPFSGLDCLMIDKIVKTLVNLSLEDELNTFLIISHNLEDCLSISDTAYIIAKPDPTRGATIVKEYDLMQMGLAWHPDVKDMPEFRSLVKEVKTLL